LDEKGCERGTMKKTGFAISIVATILSICVPAGATGVVFTSSATIQPSDGWEDVTVWGDETIVDMLGGHVYREFVVNDLATVNISGGTCYGGLDMYDQSTANISGGVFEERVAAHELSRVTITQGRIAGVLADGLSVVEIRGGEIGYLTATAGSVVHVYGRGLQLEPFGGAQDQGVITGRWENGFQFSIDLMNATGTTTRGYVFLHEVAGPVAVVERVADIYPGQAGSGAGSFVVWRDALYFAATTPDEESELWRLSGAGLVLAADIKYGPDGSGPTDLTVFRDRLYLAAESWPAGRRVHVYDDYGAAYPIPDSTVCQTPEDLLVFGDNLYFRAAAFGTYGIELWRFDGSHVNVIDLWPGTGSSGPKEFVEFEGEMYFNAVNQELWRLNAAGTGAVQVTDIANGEGSSPHSPAVYNGAIYFSANDRVHGRELWRWSPAGGAELAADICPGGAADSSNPWEMTVYEGALYFGARDTIANGYELWCYDGETARMVANINPNPPQPGGDDFYADSNPSDLTVFGGDLYFSADDGSHGREVFRYNGREVTLVDDINEGPYSSSPSGFTIYQGDLYFGADDGVSGSELWRLPGAQLILNAPAGGETLLSKREVEITWQTRGIVDQVVVDYSTDNGAQWRTVDPQNEGNTGGYLWLVPNRVSDQCLIRISSAADAGVHDVSETFSIYECPLTADVTGDCVVNLADLAVTAAQWLQCAGPDCVP
jgi:ELWxxDGT repeat protein